jgi:hypothetical protein
MGAELALSLRSGKHYYARYEEENGSRHHHRLGRRRRLPAPHPRPSRAHGLPQPTRSRDLPPGGHRRSHRPVLPHVQALLDTPEVAADLAAPC